MKEQEKKFDLDDINLIPKMGKVKSRSECDTSIKFGNHIFNIPVVPANMESTIDENLSIKLAKAGYFYIMHRFEIDVIKFLKKMQSLDLYTSISVGVNEPSYNLLEKLLKQNLVPDYITIDIAHGHSVRMKDMIIYLKNNFPNTFIIAGNVGTEEAVATLDSWGADAIKIGIGNGSACTTYPTTGYGTKNIQGSIIDKCSKITNKPIISDGGINSPSDISKLIVLGSSMVMAGGLLSAFNDSPGQLIEKENILYRSFHGSASAQQSHKKNRIEGTLKLNKLVNMNLTDYLEYLKECLQSSISYGGGRKLSDLYLVDWI